MPAAAQPWLGDVVQGLFRFHNEAFLPLMQVLGLKGDIPWLIIAACAAFALSNTSQWMRRWHPLFPRAEVSDSRPVQAWDFRPAVWMAVMVAASLIYMGESVEFYYWRF